MDILNKFKTWNKADYVLLAAVGVFFSAVIVKSFHPNILASKLFLTVAEAGLVGAVADWFAVSALFRRPFGFPYHTELVPRNRKRLIEALAKAVQDDFLNKNALKKRLSQVNLTNWVIDKLEAMDKRKLSLFGRRIINSLLPKVFNSLDSERIGSHGEGFIKEMLTKEPISPYLSEAASWAIDTGKVEQMYNFLLNELTKFAARPETREKIYNYLLKLKNTSARSNWFSGLVTWIMEETDSLNLSEAANILQAEILTTLNEFQAENHPVRYWFFGQITLIAKSLSDNDSWSKSAEAGKNAFLGKLDLAAPLSAAVSSLQNSTHTPFFSDNQSPSEKLVIDFLTEESLKFWQTFKTNQMLKEKSEDFLQYLSIDLIESSHALIGTVTKEALSRLNEQDFVQFVEEKAGEDLAWIRINGAIVGSLIGLLIGLFLHFIYDPFLVFLGCV